MGYPIFHSQYTAAQIEALIAHGTPIISGGTWWTWDIATGAYADTGLSAEGAEAWKGIAEDFSASMDYYAGDYVLYDGKLFLFTSDHSAGAWDIADVTSITVSDRLPLIINVDSATTATTIGPRIVAAVSAGQPVVLRWNVSTGVPWYCYMPLVEQLGVSTNGSYHFAGLYSVADATAQSGIATYICSAVLSASTSDNVTSYSWAVAPKAVSLSSLVGVITGTISVSATWTGSASPYSQTVTVTGATVGAKSKVDLQLTAAQLESLASYGVSSMTVENDSGVLTLYAIGGKPTAAMTIQCTVQETA